MGARSLYAFLSTAVGFISRARVSPMFLFLLREAANITCTVSGEKYAEFIDRFLVPCGCDPVLQNSGHAAFDAPPGYLALYPSLFSVRNFCFPLNRDCAFTLCRATALSLEGVSLFCISKLYFDCSQGNRPATFVAVTVSAPLSKGSPNVSAADDSG
ncbi:hypothetical protein Tco_0756536 [Tanacetum coccineum]